MNLCSSSVKYGVAVMNNIMTIEAGFLILIVCLMGVIVCVTMRIMRRDVIDLGSWPFIPEPEYMTPNDLKEFTKKTLDDLVEQGLIVDPGEFIDSFVINEPSEWKRKALAIYPNLSRLIALRDKAISKDVYYE